MWAHELLNNAEMKAMDKLPKYIPKDLLVEFDRAVDDQGNIEDQVKHAAIIAQFADEFKLITREVFSAVLEEDLGVLWKKVNELEKAFKTHRHALDKPYSEKPAW